MEESIRLLEELNEYEIALSSEFISYLKRLLFLEVSALDIIILLIKIEKYLKT